MYTRIFLCGILSSNALASVGGGVCRGDPFKLPSKWDAQMYTRADVALGAGKSGENQEERIEASMAHGTNICVANLQDSWDPTEGPTVLANVWVPYESIKDANASTGKFGGLSDRAVLKNKPRMDLVREGSSVVQVQTSKNGPRTPWVLRLAAMSAKTCVLPLPECGIVISGREPIVFSSSDE